MQRYDFNKLMNPSDNNLFMNGGFTIWQRSNTPNTNGGYGADRWYVSPPSSTGGTTSVTVEQAVAGEFSSDKCLRMDISGHTSPLLFLNQPIEDVKLLGGKTVTFSIEIKSTVPVYVKALWQQRFGTGGSSNVSGDFSELKLVPANTPTKVEFTFDVASVSDKTFARTLSCTVFQLHFYGSDKLVVPANGTYRIAAAKLEFGSSATPFTSKNDALEIVSCQRYFERGIHHTTCQNASVTNNTSTCQFKVQKRTTPTVTLYNWNSGAVGQVYGETGNNYSGTANMISSNEFRTYVAGVVPVNEHLHVIWTSDAEF